MPATFTATKQGKYRSLVSFTATHSPGSAEVITIAHGLNRTPDVVYAPVLRSVQAYGGGALSTIMINPELSYRSANASVVVFDGVGSAVAGGGAWVPGSPTIGNFTVLCEVTHSIIK